MATDRGESVRHWHCLDSEAVATHLDSDLDAGLTAEAAKSRLGLVGLNTLHETGRRRPLAMLASQFTDFMILVLIAAAVIAGFIGEPQESDQSTPAPPSPPPTRASDPVPPARAASRLRSTLVDRADNPIPPDAPVPSDSLSARRAPSPSERRNESRPQPPSPSSPARRRPETWTGRPPGLIEEDLAPQNAGLANSPAIRNGRGRDMTANGPSMELGGYLVYYDVLSEERLRAWARQGMKELSIPLPGTRYYMVCPLEIALRRGSGKCRALDPDSPEMAAIGDAREAVTMLQVYKQGELVWRGPGPYR